ncbi:hypothetical protein B5V00_12325 [Geothermobacter hydrogeniphilus]|uniref:TRAP transporter solute receptor, TAXI family n=1 Tax=Geothermobacter hydrogeniphilus TaxID=1969733 RepID=A0A1X0XZH8_9BACT|nr:hypothetical protein B5V00_12325 [Geothermobacter hydrogeniphilus]
MAARDGELRAANKKEQVVPRRVHFPTFILLLFLMMGCDSQQQTILIGGGPSGGTFQGYAEALQEVTSTVAPKRQWRVESSAGSIGNLEDLDAGRLDLAMVYAGDAWLGRRGQLPDEASSFENVRALGRLYGAAAQLVVAESSAISQLSDLIGKRVAIGNPGSGTALAARRFFSSVGLWQRIVPIHVGFSMGLGELERGSVEAVWLVVGYPNRALVTAAENRPLRFIDLFSEARESGFFRQFPFYTEKIIPPATYPGQVRRVWTFEDSALLAARADLDADLVYRLLQRLYADAGMEAMAERHPIGRQLDRRLGLNGIRIPLHPGAERFWRGQGML